MSRVNEYRAKAAEFIAQAEKSTDLNSRIMLLELAESWPPWPTPPSGTKKASTPG